MEHLPNPNDRRFVGDASDFLPPGQEIPIDTITDLMVKLGLQTRPLDELSRASMREWWDGQLADARPINPGLIGALVNFEIVSSEEAGAYLSPENSL